MSAPHNAPQSQQSVSRRTIQQSNEYKTLWSHLHQLIASYTSSPHASFPNLHFQEYITTNRLSDVNDADESLQNTTDSAMSQQSAKSPTFTDLTFLSECLDAITDRYKISLIAPTISLYYSFNKQLSSTDRTTYEIFTYLLIMRLNELSLRQFRMLTQFSGLSTGKMVEFLKFLYDAENIRSFLAPEWQKSFDHEWVQEELIGSLEMHRDEVMQWVQQLEERLSGTQELRAEDLPQITIPEPFNLTQPKVKVIPQPKVIETTFKARDVPASTYECEPQVERALQSFKEGKKNVPLISEEEQQRIREDIQKNIKGPLFTKLNERAEKRAKDTTQKLKFELKKKIREDMEKRKPKIKSLDEVRKMMNQAAKVKYNTAAMLREDALLKQKQEKEASVLKQYETELRDASNYYEWQEEMRRKDEIERQLRLEERKLEMELTDARARQARIEQEERNRLEASQLKEETEKQLEKLKAEQEAEQQKLRDQAAQLQEEIRLAVEKAKTKDKREKEEIADQIRRQKHKQELILARQLELERQRKEELVMQIKAQEAVKPAQEPKFDPTETKGDGLLNEMSYVEMKNRLELQRQQEEELRRQKQEQIERSREKKRQELMEKSKRISEYRQMASAESKKRKVERLRQEYKERAMMQKERDSKLIALQEKIQEHKEKQQQEREQRKEEERQLKMKAKFLGAAKRDRELKHWKQQEEGKSREAFQRAREAKINFESMQKVQQKERSIVLQNKRQERDARQKTLKQIDETIREKHKLNVEEQENQKSLLSTNARIRHDFEKGLKEEIETMKNPLGYGSLATS